MKTSREIKLSQERWKLVTENLHLVDKVLFYLLPKYKNISKDIDEYREIATEALIHSARKFDFSRKTAKFSTYAITAIKRDVIKKYRRNAQLKCKFLSKDEFQENFFNDSEDMFCSNDIDILENLENQEQINELKEIIKNLPEKEIKIIQLYIFENKTFSQIGKFFNVSREMARLYYKNILKKLKDRLGVLI
jgi:RNA polymerase sigma factor (sigma-70 family)